jgi:hypothetical protein
VAGRKNVIGDRRKVIAVMLRDKNAEKLQEKRKMRARGDSNLKPSDP